eukprot:4666437-Prymnesium_polylepis.1
MSVATAALAATLNMTMALPAHPEIMHTGPAVINLQSRNLGSAAETQWVQRRSMMFRGFAHYPASSRMFKELSAGLRQAGEDFGVQTSLQPLGNSS